jgi:hypothetical protein
VAVLPVAEDLVLPLVKRYELRFHIIEFIIIVPLIQIVILEALLRVHQLRIIAIVQNTIYKVKAGQVLTLGEAGPLLHLAEVVGVLELLDIRGGDDGWVILLVVYSLDFLEDVCYVGSLGFLLLSQEVVRRCGLFPVELA